MTVSQDGPWVLRTLSIGLSYLLDVTFGGTLRAGDQHCVRTTRSSAKRLEQAREQCRSDASA